MQVIVYDGSFEGFLCAVFNVYEYKFTNVNIVPAHLHQPSVFADSHIVNINEAHSSRVLNGLRKKLSAKAMQQLYKTFLSELDGIENVLLRYIQYCFSSTNSIEMDYGHEAVITVFQTAKKVHREKHRMEAFVRFEKTTDELFYAVVEPDYNVLPLIAKHFTTRYADQKWLIYDSRRKYGIHYDLQKVSTVAIHFVDENKGGNLATNLYDANEEIYQRLWQQYFKSVNIAARKNTRLHIQHMPRRYWKNLTEKKTG